MTHILAISDQVVNTLYSENVAELVAPVDMLLGCGDLPYSYMEYIVTQVPVRHALFVHGNHDSPEYHNDGRVVKTPGGWQNIDCRVVYVKHADLLVAGLEGSIRYNPRAPYQYTEREMRFRARRLILRLLLNRVWYGRYLDIFIAHSPAYGIHDGTDHAHQGFKVFLSILQRFRPRLFLHGHKHHYGPVSWHTAYVDTEVVNVHPFRLINLTEQHIEYGKLYRR